MNPGVVFLVLAWVCVILAIVTFRLTSPQRRRDRARVRVRLSDHRRPRGPDRRRPGRHS